VGLDSGFRVYLGTGAGTFTVTPIFGAAIPGALDLEARDFNGDGTQDLAILARDAMHIYLGKGDGTFWA
jgi:hypothetical protein